jgi:1-deoxy-D-xylulose-5-phosphate synthase
MVLDRIERPNDIKKINPAEYSKLASEIREFLIDKISVTGGHLASNLGVVELTMALHLFLNLPKDKLIWDVGHQSYTHKLLTGRKERFDSLRLLGGMSGFPNRNECTCDAFNTGHSSTSISAGLGIAQARELLGEDYKVVSVIGDGALTGGLAYEALNNASQLKSNFIIVLNDNEMSISENIGGVSRMLSSIRTDPSYMQLKDRVKLNLMKLPGGGRLVRGISSTKQGIKQLVIPGMLFEDMDLTYVGPVDGHDIQRMVDAFNNASRVKGAVVVHVKTQKGRGYAPAEEQPEKYHGVNPFIVKTG